MSSVEPIADRLAGVRAHVRQLYLRQGTASLLLWICAFLGATFAVDFCIPNLPRAVRLLFLCGGLGGLAYGYYRFLRYPLAARLSDDDLAAHLELQYPGLRDRLISTVQLLRRGADRQTSPEMVKALTVETVRAARELDFNAILLPERPRRLSVLAGIGVAALLVAAASCPQFAGIYLSRLCGSATPWPRKTQLSVQY
ncbi:MAG: hypothetical protein HZA54_12875, partial [Planctomycetes bacterium]|nr:hypothetical protein [Planctomycetota bacterium]